MTCFNPCFCGTGARTGRLSVFMVSEERVSILVFVELALELYTVHGSAYLVLVSILVFVELALERHVRGVTTKYSVVSILVFVELALEPKYQRP